MTRRRVLAVAACVALSLLTGCSAGGAVAGDAESASPAATVPPPPVDVPTPAPAAPSPAASPVPYGDLDVDLAGPGLHPGSIDGPDGPRTFRVHLPEGPTADAPLLLALHPFTFDGEAFERLTGLADDATARGVVTVFPDGVARSWNGGLTCCPPATGAGIDDVGFVRALATRLQDALDLDPDRTWAVGFSNGGFLALRLACEAPDVVSAVVSHAATMDRDCRPDEPVSVLVSHGADDELVPFAGGRGPVSPQAEGRGAREVFAAWLAIDGCPAPVPRSSVADELATPCAGGTRVGLAVWPDLGHAWPAEGNTRFLDWLEAVPPRHVTARSAGYGRRPDQEQGWTVAR